MLLAESILHIVVYSVQYKYMKEPAALYTTPVATVSITHFIVERDEMNT